MRQRSTGQIFRLSTSRYALRNVHWTWHYRVAGLWPRIDFLEFGTRCQSKGDNRCGRQESGDPDCKFFSNIERRQKRVASKEEHEGKKGLLFSEWNKPRHVHWVHIRDALTL